MSLPAFLLSLIIIFAAAKLFGELAERIGQPAVLGEMIGGVVVGISGLGLIDPHEPVLHLLGELGVILLLFLIGLETDVGQLLSSGVAATLVALTGVVAPFVLGFGVARLFGLSFAIAVFVGASLTATSVGITARVLSDLGQLHSCEARIILGAAVLDDILGLIILSIVTGVAAGKAITVLGIAKVTLTAFGFVVAAVVCGLLLAPRLIRIVAHLRVTKALFFSAFMFALSLAWCADAVGSALIIGAFAAGLVLARTDRAAEIEHETHDIAQFFVPMFFVLVGAAIDLHEMNPWNAQGRVYLLLGIALTVVGIGGKIAAGYTVRGVNRRVIGIGMIPRGEVGLIFAQIGMSAGLLSSGQYSSIALMVILTTLVTPPLLRRFLPPTVANEVTTLSSVVTESLTDSVPR